MDYPLALGGDSVNTVASYGSTELPVIAGILVAVLLALLTLATLTVIAVWKINVKGGEPGWAVFVPVYGSIVLLRIGGQPTAWAWLLALPLLCTITELTNDTMAITDPVGFVMLPVVSCGASLTLSVITGVGLARAFSRSQAFGICALGVLPTIGYLILGFGRSQHYLNSAPFPGSPDVTSRAYPAGQEWAARKESREDTPYQR